MLQSREFKELRKPEGYPREIVTLGDHILARRLDRGLLQNEVARALNISVQTLITWEKNRRQPHISAYQNIFRFLKCSPLNSSSSLRTFGDRLVLSRQLLGITQREAAKRIGIDPSTLSRYERNIKLPPPILKSHIEQFIGNLTSGSLASGTDKCSSPCCGLMYKGS